MSKHILLIAANPAVSSTTGWPVGYWASEIAHPWHVFTQKGYQITIASPEGGALEMDAMSDPSNEYSSWDTLSKEVLQNQELLHQLQSSRKIDDLEPADFDAIVVAGGQAPMFTFGEATHLHDFFTRFYESGKPTAALCHGTAVLRYAKLADGTPLIKGKTVTGFTNGEEQEADQAAGTQVMPWRIEDELEKLGAQFKKKGNWESYAIADGNLITGQQNMSGEETARLVVQKLENE
jgi:putative intracellular protease/amidase